MLPIRLISRICYDHVAFSRLFAAFSTHAMNTQCYQGALNNGCSDNNGKIVGVIHEMWVIDGESHSAFQSGNRELLIARGDDLQERKKLLVKDADAIIVLPGGPGTWDELMEMACAKNLGLMDLPIVCVNVDGYYDSLGQMFHRGNQDGLIKLMPHEIFRFESTSVAAIKFIELDIFLKQRRAKQVCRKRPILQSQASMIGDAMGYLSNLMTKGGQLQTTHSFSVGDNTVSSLENDGNSRKVSRKFSLEPSFASSLFTFAAGVLAGLGIAMKTSSRKT